MVITKNHSTFGIGVLAVLVVAVLIGVGIGRHSANSHPTGTPLASTPQTGNDPNSSVAALVSYNLPQELIMTNCSGSTVYLVPNGTATDCTANVPAPIQISVDAHNTTDCNQLQPSNNQGIRDHVCKSLYIDGHKSLQALTEYSTASSYKVDTTFADYYISTGKAVVKYEYIYTSSSPLTDQFNQLALSTKVH